MRQGLAFVLLLACGTALTQQQLLLRRPPRLLGLSAQPIHSGSAALDANFSRPMHRNNVAAESRVVPSVPHRWLGDGNPLRLVIDAEAPITAPLELRLAGRDQRMEPLTPQRWWWDPRPWMLITRQVQGGEQLQLLTRAGDWLPMSPTWTALQSVVPLGNGKGVAMVSSNDDGEEQIWWQPLKSTNIARSLEALDPPEPGPVESLVQGTLLFGHLSSNLNGDLLVQTGGLRPGSERVELIQASGRRRVLTLQASGPMQLLPAGGGVVIPTYDGLKLQSLLSSDPSQAQMLPGSREVGAFCAASGRAVLIRHWPDYRRSIELVVPGQAPKQLLLGEKAVLGVACDGSGKRIWAVLGAWNETGGEHELVLINETGDVLNQRRLTPWMMKAGTPIGFDPVSQQLLMTVIPPEQISRAGQPALIDAKTLEPQEVMPVAVGEALWLRP
ncbi:MAG: hypothetical protein VXZ59_02205 [Cyanobacteriota bacterium]|nr:hypothetical protein [Cyanobacteriota bacterium]